MKLRVDADDGRRLREHLARLGAKGPTQGVQTDVFWSPADRPADEEPPWTLRLRQAAGGFELTWKGARTDLDGVKVRPEHNVRCQDDPSDVLSSLGFRPILRLRKHRTLWRLGDVAVTLDELEGVGLFVEVERITRDATATDGLHDVVASLGLAGAAVEARSYARLASEAGSPALERL